MIGAFPIFSGDGGPFHTQAGKAHSRDRRCAGPGAKLECPQIANWFHERRTHFAALTLARICCRHA